MAIAYSIYIITKDGNIESYAGGTRDTFTVTGLTNPSQIIADIDLDNIYVADNGNGRVVVFDTKGNFVKEYKPKKDGAWSDIRSIGVSPNEKILFVLNGSKIFKLDIQ